EKDPAGAARYVGPGMCRLELGGLTHQLFMSAPSPLGRAIVLGAGTNHRPKKRKLRDERNHQDSGPEIPETARPASRFKLHQRQAGERGAQYEENVPPQPLTRGRLRR